ncbi:MAG: hypothetical protein ACT4QA_15895, partial [Panacagrimonas sp.]
FTHVAARMTRWPPNEAFSGSASTHSLPPESLPVLPGGAFPGRTSTDGSTAPFQGTHNSLIDPAQLHEAVQKLRTVVGEVVSYANEHAGEEIRSRIEREVLELSREQLLRDRALVAPQG